MQIDRTSRLPAAGLTLALLACGAPAERVDTGLESLPTWRADPVPTLDLDGGETGFGAIGGIALLGNGALAVGDAYHRQVLLYDGELEASRIGGRGEGPGEFESIDGLWAVGRDSVAVWDARLVRYTPVGSDGGMGAPVTLRPTGERAKPTPLGFAPDGRLLVVNDARGFLEEDTYRPPLELIAYGSDGGHSPPIAVFPGPEMWNWVWEMGVTPSTVPFGRPTVVALAGGDILVGTNEGYTIERYALDGARAPHIRLEREPRDLSPASIEAYREAQREKARSGASPKGGDDVFAAMAEDAPYPRTLPGYDALLVDSDGNLWVRDYVIDAGLPTTWLVFDPAGAPLARAELPARFTPAIVDSGTVIGVWRDPLDVERVRAYRVE